MSCDWEMASPFPKVERSRKAAQKPTNSTTVGEEPDHVAGATLNAERLAEHPEHTLEPLDNRGNLGQVCREILDSLRQLADCCEHLRAVR